MNRIVNYFKNLPAREAKKFLLIFYTVGITGFLVPYSRPVFERMIPLSLGVNLFMLFLFHRPFNRLHLVLFSIVVFFTIAVEALGVKTGLIFGEYYYGDTMGMKVFETPILIGFNWLMLAYGAMAIARQIKFMRKWTPLFAALMLVAFDFIMEPVAMKTGMWSWAFNVVPWQNYAGWFIVSVVVVSLFDIFEIETPKSVAPSIFVLQAIFFLALNIFLP